MIKRLIKYACAIPFVGIMLLIEDYFDHPCVSFDITGANVVFEILLCRFIFVLLFIVAFGLIGVVLLKILEWTVFIED